MADTPPDAQYLYKMGVRAGRFVRSHACRLEQYATASPLFHSHHVLVVMRCPQPLTFTNPSSPLSNLSHRIGISTV